MSKYRTALGKVVDMSILASKHEKTRAVGNMNVNARGDTIDSQGNIIKPATAKVNEAYSKTVGNRSAQPVRKQPRTGDDQPRTVVPRHGPVQPRGVNQSLKEVEELTKSELELDEDMSDDVEVEQIKAREKNGK